MNDLLRQVARADEAAADPAPAIARLGDYYLNGMMAVRRLVEVVISMPAIVSQPPPALPDLSDHDLAVDWMDAEWGNLTATFWLALELRLDVPAVGLGQLAMITHARRGGVARLRHGLQASLSAAEALGDLRLLARHRYLLGASLMREGRIEQAVSELEAARRLMAAEGDIVGEAIALEQLAEIRLYAADAAGALELMLEVTALLPPGEADAQVRVRTVLGEALVQLGRYEEAREVVSQLVEVARGLDRQKERVCLDVLGRAALGLGDARTALEFAERAVVLSRATRHPVFEAASLTDAAVALRHLGAAEEADSRNGEAERILERADEPHRMTRNLLRYADACGATGDQAAAARHFETVLELATTHDFGYLVPTVRARLAQVS